MADDVAGAGLDALCVLVLAECVDPFAWDDCAVVGLALGNDALVGAAVGHPVSAAAEVDVPGGAVACSYAAAACCGGVPT